MVYPLQCPYPVAVCDPEQAVVARSLPELEEKETSPLPPPPPHTSTPPPSSLSTTSPLPPPSPHTSTPPPSSSSTTSHGEEWLTAGEEMNFDLVKGVAAQNRVTLDPTTEAMLDAIMNEIAQ